MRKFLLLPRRILLFLALLSLSMPLASPAYSGTASGPMTLNLSVDHGVPLTLSAPASSVFIANPDVADVQVLSPTSVMVFGKRTGQTTLMATDNNGRSLLHRTIMVTQNLEDLRLALRAVIPDNKINVEAVPNGIVLTGEARDPGVVDDARRLALRYVPRENGEVINRIKVRGSNQINIRVRFAEVTRDVDKRFGIDWESIGTFGGFAFGLMSGDASSVVSAGNLLGRTRPTTDSNTNDILSFSSKGDGWNVNGLIDALAMDGFLTILAEPNLTAMSGETASFLAGGEFPVPIPQDNNVTIEWKTYGVSLAFTPTLIGEDRINLHVRPEVSQLSDAGSIVLSGFTIPGLTTRRAETTIELASGQSFAIAGLLNNNQTQTINKYPFLGDMPVLGQLFRSTRFQNDETELVIIITPYIVKPATEERFALPMDGYSPPSDVDRIFRKRMTNSDPGARAMSGAPRAVVVQPPALQPLSEYGADSPPPVAAPLMPVSSTAHTESDAGSPPLLSKPVPSEPSHPAVHETKVAERPREPERYVDRRPPPVNPAGPSGFILE